MERVMPTSLRISAPHFVAGAIFDEQGYVYRVAPILGWMVREGVTLDEARAWCERRQYTYEESEIARSKVAQGLSIPKGRVRVSDRAPIGAKG